MIYRISLLSLFIFNLAVWAGDVDTGSYQSPTDRQGSDLMGKPQKGGQSVAPVIGYEPTFKFVFGAAYFYEKETFSIGTDFNLNFRQVYQVHMNLLHKFAPDWEYELNTGVTKGFDPYYGEGGETDPANFVRIWGTRSNTRLKLSRHFSHIFDVGLFSEFRLRTEEVNPEEPLPRQYPDEMSTSVGLSAEVDTRDNKQDPKDGFMFIVEGKYIPQKLASLPAQEGFGQLEGSFIVYKEILNKLLPNVIAAFRLKSGMTMGTPSYTFRYKLGGTDELPGYLDNRFRGKKYYMQQTELRFPIWKMLSGAGILGFGDTTDSSFTNAKMAYGIGIRIGLPPDWVSKIRIDYAFGRDQQGVFADFGQSF